MASALETLLGTELVDGRGQKVAVKTLSGNDKVVGLYFSAHWCPPCRGFTPKLAEFYVATKASHGDKLEIVFISSDRDAEQWKAYFGEMPWLALPFSDRERKGKLCEKYGVTGIPTLVILDGSTGTIITKDGRERVTNNPGGFPWK
jgi:nucleoredoxin